MFLGLLILILLLWGFLQTDAGQNWMARQVTQRLSRDLQTRISIKHVSLGLFSFNHMDLEGVLVEDQKKDTLLYAGTVQVRITDWFLFKDKAELKFIGLENAVVNLNRTDSTWNYAFLEQYFATPSTGAKKKAGIEFDLKKVLLRNVSFVQHDAWLGADLRARVGGLDLDANQLTLTGKTIDVRSLKLDAPDIWIFSYPGKSTDTLKKASAKTAASTPEWAIRFGTVSINNGRFRDDIGTLGTKLTYFDSRHLDFSAINGTLTNVGWTADTVRGQVNLSTRERSGLVVKKLKANTTFHPQGMIFDQLQLETNRSVLGPYFAMKYKSLADLNDFLHAVRLEADFRNARISSDDIAFFAPDLKSWKKELRITGKVKGSVDDFSSPDLEIAAGRNTYLRGSVSMVGLPDINETLINVDARELRTTYSDVVDLVPAVARIRNPDLRKLQYLQFRGTYTGLIHDFVTLGTIQTALGTLNTELNMKLPPKGDAVYTGRIATNGFQLGALLNNSKLGIVEFTGNVAGRGFDWNTMSATVNGTLRRFHYNDYTYQNITLRDTLARKTIRGLFTIQDPNVKLRLRGLIDLAGDKPYFNLRASVDTANLQALGFTPRAIRLRGDIDVNARASSLSDLLGKANVNNAVIYDEDKTIPLDAMTVNSGYENGLHFLTVQSAQLDADIRGQFNLDELPAAFQLFLHRYYPSYIKAPKAIAPQIFTYSLTTRQVDDYIKLVDPQLSGFNNATIRGSLNTSSNAMVVEADLPQFQYSQYDFQGVKLDGTGTLDSLVLTGTVANARVGDSLEFPQTSFGIRAGRDQSDVTISTTSNQAINQANVSARITTFPDGASVFFNPSTFSLNGKTWTVQQGEEALSFRKNTPVIGELVLRESNQEIRLQTKLSETGSTNDLFVQLRNINLGDIGPFITKKNRIEGLLSGEVTVEDPQGRFEVISNLRAQELRRDNDSIGGLEAKVNFNRQTGLITGSGNNTDPEHRVEFNIGIDIKDTANTYRDHINTRLTNFQLKYLNRFLGSLFSDIEGYATGNFDIVGEGTNRDFLAKARLRDASFKVNYTQVRYAINDTEIELKHDTISLEGVRVRDDRGNTARVSGYIAHQAFTNMFYDIMLNTESDRMLLLNTTYTDNQQFYGRARGGGTFNLVGPQNDMFMNIRLKASEFDSSEVTLPPSNSRTTGQAPFMIERKYGREMSPDASASTNNLNFDIRLTANPRVNVRVLLDELTQDVIEARGVGDLRITSGTNEPLALRGRYTIQSGSYDFSFQALLKKPFVLNPNTNNFIEWNGDPYDAQIHIVADYKTTQPVSFAPLAVAAPGLNLNSVRDFVTVQTTMTGNLFQPKFAFKLNFDEGNNRALSRPEFALALQQIQNNQNELNKQVTYLIVFNSFAPVESAAADQGFNPFGELTYSTISGLLFGKVNQELNRLLSKVLKNNRATFNVTGSVYNRNVFDQNSRGGFRLPNQSNVGVALGLPLLNDRARLTIGGNVDVPLSNDYNQTVRLLPDVTLELQVNKSGSVRATFFFRQNVDFFALGSGNPPRRYGASIGYGRGFNSLRELFGSKPKKPQPDSTRTEAKKEEDSVKTVKGN